MESRIISVADAFDAMTTDRQYRHRLPLEKAVEQLVLGKGTQFDARVVDAFLEMIGDYESIQSQIAWTYTDMQANGKRT
jgi:HD-GYP domain-containing protein (c-di-GMP phosphodiesterase class II)